MTVKRKIKLRVDENLDRYIAGIERYAVMSREDEQVVARAYQETKDPKMREKLINANLRFVVKVAHEYNGYGFRILDIIQEGNVGLVIAADKFEPERGWRFISMAVWWIRAHIQNYLLRHWSVVRVGTTQRSKKLFYKLRSAQNQIAKLRLPPDEEAQAVAKLLGVREQDVIEMTCRLNRDCSLNMEIDDDGQVATFQDVIVDERDSVEEKIVEVQDAKALHKLVERVFEGLNEREAHVVVRRCMIDEPLTLHAIGDDLNVSKERVRQIEKRAMNKLKRALETAA
jgi:RNA polymerase sigma-32 factor